MAPNEPHEHHYAPQFFLRNFAIDEEKRRIAVVTKHDAVAVWDECSIESIAHETDYYVHMRAGVPVSVETEINKGVETPISQSDTWAKIATGNTDQLDQSDRAVLYVLIRHLQFRTPHAAATFAELAEMAADPNSVISFTAEERSVYAALRADPNMKKHVENYMAATTEWTEGLFRGSLLEIMRSPIDLRSSTTPVLTIPAPWHPAMHLPVPGMSPHRLALTLNPRTIVCLTLGDFDGAFSNCEIDEETALTFNLHFVGQFARFDYVRHLIAGRDGLINDMRWAPYDLVKDTPRKITFRRRPASHH